MEGSRTNQITQKLLEARFERLKEDLEAISQQIDRTQNAQDKNQLKRQFSNTQEEMKDVEQELDKLDLTKINTNCQALLKLLTPFETKLSAGIEQAYSRCLPEDWQKPLPDSLTDILANLEDIPPSTAQSSTLILFVAHLVGAPNTPESLARQLSSWAESKDKGFLELVRQVGTHIKGDLSRKSYLMVAIWQSNQGSVVERASRYFVDAWVVPDDQAYQPESGIGCDRLAKVELDKTFTLEEIKVLLKDFLQQSSQYSNVGNLTVEIFLPLALLNDSIDGWVIDEEDFGFSESIGKQYRLIVRSYERLTPIYARRRAIWQQKWESLQELMSKTACGHFVSGDDGDVNQLLTQLRGPEVMGLKLTTAPVKTGKGSALAAILQTAIPVALWLRQNLPSLNCQDEVDQILNCCLHQLPDEVRQRRLYAQPDTEHIGHHLSLLWEDPNRLPVLQEKLIMS